MRDIQDRPFHPFVGAVPVVPQRFVWHVARGSDAGIRASIERFGLLAGFSELGCVFANNQSSDLECFYPYTLYGLCESRAFTGEFLAPDDDIWRVDTARCNARWFIDPFMRKEGQRGPSLWYIYTRANILPTALRRFRVLPSLVERSMVVENDGVTSVVGPLMPIAPYPFREEDMGAIVVRSV